MGLVVFIKGVIDQGIMERRTLFLSYTLDLDLDLVSL